MDPVSAIGGRLVVVPGPTLSAFRAEYETDPGRTTLFDSLSGHGPGPWHWRPGMLTRGGLRVVPLADRILVLGTGRVRFRSAAGREVDLDVAGALAFGPDGSWSEPPTAQAEAAARVALGEWDDWMARCPGVLPEHQDLVRSAWSVLGFNTLRLRSHPDLLGVVPCLLGYVGVWQWDAYFIARGLRHGAPEVAAQQLELVLASHLPDGQLVDVVFDDGVLASSADLPESDLASLRALASPFADLAAPVPLTKPPLAAWALEALTGPDAEQPGALDWAWPIVARSQRWWYERIDPAAVYPHPYCSGLDDSPVFDHQHLVDHPDLLAYLIVQEQILGRHGHPVDRGRPAELSARLDRLFDPARGSYLGPGQPDTIVALMGLFGSSRHLADLVATITDPSRYGIDPGVPTVSRADAMFQPDRMWRGPAWLNTNCLLVDALERHGRADLADALAASSLAMVRGAGMVEYIDVMTGRKGDRAVEPFSWTAAVVVDFAVRLASAQPGSAP